MNRQCLGIAPVAFFVLLWSASLGSAETYRCTFDRTIAVGNNNLFEDKKDHKKDEEYFVALDAVGRGGKVSQCTPSGRCGNLAKVQLITRWSAARGSSMMLRLVVGGDDQIGQIWSIEGDGVTADLTVVAVSALGQRSDTEFGKCRKVMD
ncbi:MULTISPECIES: hypothetical protein [unclassified Bradyrhizobium]|uniref:hypothetical protein n=1 Tax=unclassified Bradyrhizobium TaxID=2631580 RepID=UPI00211E43AA|nr:MULTISPECIES: hypothetical protein [unclassified Bradyrhizobium]MDD1536095.1 hypothetical protein [Bradyrhizobium sp. WBOS8]MDD1585665.1 hypothetical protein [Bradyrhizobium sp. WBOS4]UUO49057.1 hypothetical protein DCM78_20355 [Bradyrhizobium sp. WBOS04]UUO62872.1 hypothetical protein DCM80_29230 [Bradyrhizobium sp. WBOS08]